ncbi:hypothetical protein GCK32_019647 [Trichostrongylus colubriformis]|uniref:Uncharacterized protein n=1 Tax=Trichostrongylus colubriformis TaxID=6319 RepID=A0AAN8IRA8_TRICO
MIMKPVKLNPLRSLYQFVVAFQQELYDRWQCVAVQLDAMYAHFGSTAHLTADAAKRCVRDIVPHSRIRARKFVRSCSKSATNGKSLFSQVINPFTASNIQKALILKQVSLSSLFSHGYAVFRTV